MLTFSYKPPKTEQQSTGDMQAGVPVTFSWHTPASGIVDQGTNGRLQVVAPPGNNASFKATLNGVGRTGSGQTSFSWPFGSGMGHVPQLPDTDYTGEITADIDCAGVTLKLTAR